MMKKVFCLCLSVLFCFMFPLFSFSVSYTPYASVTTSTANIQLLISTMLNQSDFDPFKDWVGIRTGQYDYSVFYNIDDGDNVVRLRYYGVQNGYNIDYYYSKTIESNFSYYRGNYTVVGNTEDSLASADFQNFYNRNIVNLSLPFILIVFLFFVFRIRKSHRGTLSV